MPSGVDSKYVFSNSLVRDQCESTVDMVLGETLKDSTIKSDIIEGCTGMECPYIVKVKQLFSQDELNQFLQEIFFAQFVNKEYAVLKQNVGAALEDIPSVTPMIYDAWFCPDKYEAGVIRGNMVMDRMDMSLLSFVKTHDLTLDHFAYLEAYLEKLFQPLVVFRIWHRNITLNNIVTKGNFPSLKLFVIDWDDIVWMKDDEATLVRRYKKLIYSLLDQIKHQQKRSLKEARKVRIESIPLYNPAETFRPIPVQSAQAGQSEIKEFTPASTPYSMYSAPVIASFTPPTPRQVSPYYPSYPSYPSNFQFSSTQPISYFS
jgi:hypothetical protein